MAESIKPKERDSIVQALTAGVVPRLGLRHVQVGRAREIEALLKDVERLAEDGSFIRLVIGEYGSGKTFFLNLVRLIALEKGLVVVNADLGPDRRLHATGGQARSLYSELLRNMATRTRPEGGALASVVERFVSQAHEDAVTAGKSVESVIKGRLAPLEELVSGYDFASVLTEYWKGSDDDNDEKKSAALRWLRGEWATKTEARLSLGVVRAIIDDAGMYDYLKLMARFVKMAGYKGMLVVLDEMVNLYKLQNAPARNANYEQILRVLNDVLQGSASGIGFVMGGTPEFLMDTRRGLYSYPALQSRLAENAFARDGLIDLSGPVVRLQSLSREDLFVLLGNIRNVFAGGDATKHLVPDEALIAFMQHCSKHIGDAFFRTPRTTAKAFVNLLAVIEQNPGADWRKMIDGTRIEKDTPLTSGEVDEGSGESNPGGNDGDELESFRL